MTRRLARHELPALEERARCLEIKLAQAHATRELVEKQRLPRLFASAKAITLPTVGLRCCEGSLTCGS